jgi:hypothetical protein
MDEHSADAIREPTPPPSDVATQQCRLAFEPCRPACRARFDKDLDPLFDPASDPLFACETSCSNQYKACTANGETVVSIDQAIAAGVAAKAKNK